MAVMTIPLRSGNHLAPDVVEIPLDDPVTIYRPRPIKVKQEAAPQKNNRVAPGHEGSRRRRRQEMQNLLGCPQRVEPTEEDWAPVEIRRSTISWDKLATVEATRPIEVRRSIPVSKTNALPRSIRQEIKRAHVSPEFVYSIEKEFRDVIDPSSAEPEYDVVETDDLTKAAMSVKRTVHIAIEAPTDKARSYSRWWIHLISKYYNLKSHSEDYQNQRVACVDLTGHKLPTTWFCDLL